MRSGRRYTTAEGIPTTGVFGYLNCLLSIVKQQDPSHVIVCFDAGGNNRKTEDTDYKSTRKPLEPDFIAENRILLNEALYSLGIESVGLKGYEADDLLWTYSTVAQFGIEQFDEVVIATVDQDMLQAVTTVTKVLLWNSSKKQQLMDTNAVVEKWGCFPEDIAYVKALSGDASDNIKGIPGIGKKTAVKICNEAQWLPDEIHKHPKVNPHVQRVLDNLDLIYLRNCTGVIGPIRWDDYKLGLGMKDDYTEFLDKYEFSSLQKRADDTAKVMQLR